MQIKTIMASAAIIWLASACSSNGKLEDYQRSSSIKEIAFPEGMEAVALPPLYPIPEIRVREEAFYNLETDGFVVPRPEPMSAEREKAKIKIQKVGERRWILAEAPTSQVWPLAQSFLLQYDMGASRTQPKTGLVETDWVTFNDDESKRHQFRIRIEQGVRIDTTEIHILHRAIEKSLKKPGDSWPVQSDELAREEWVLNEMANSLAGNVGNRAASLLGQEVGGDVKAELFMDGSEPAILLRLDDQRAWATVAHALSKEGYRLWDEDSERKLFFVQHESLAPKRNWFFKLIAGETTAERTAPFKLSEALTQLDGRPSVRKFFAGYQGVQFGKPAEDGYGLLVVLSAKGSNQVVVKIRDFAGRTLPLQTNKQLLAVIRRNLI